MDDCRCDWTSVFQQNLTPQSSFFVCFLAQMIQFLIIYFLKYFFSESLCYRSRNSLPNIITSLFGMKVKSVPDQNLILMIGNLLPRKTPFFPNFFFKRVPKNFEDKLFCVTEDAIILIPMLEDCDQTFVACEEWDDFL